MRSTKAPATTVDEYIAGFTPPVQDLLEQVRAAVKAAAPKAEECINYQIPTFTLQGNLLHYAAYKNHIGFYPTPSGIKAFQQELAGYKSAKGSVQFPLNEPLPLDLITRIALFRAEENLKDASA
ncbi:iron chaperone [Mucilaginibacter sp.]